MFGVRKYKANLLISGLGVSIVDGDFPVNVQDP